MSDKQPVPPAMPDGPHKRIADALEMAMRYGGIDGSHHKSWVIDQMVRALTGGYAYDIWIIKHNRGGYEWDEGIEP